MGLFTDAAGFPLMVKAFEGNKAEAATMLPVIKAFMAVHRLDVGMVADAGMISESNTKAIEAERLSFIPRMKIPEVPYVVNEWRRKHAGERSRTGTCSSSPWLAGLPDGQIPTSPPVRSTTAP